MTADGAARARLAAGLRWPMLAAPYDDALAQAIAFVLAETEPVGIVATGTIIRGNPHATSDLDLYVIHRAPVRRRVQRFFNGVPAELLINPPPMIRSYLASERNAGRLITAHMLATGFVMLATDPVIEDLRAEARGSLASPPTVSADDAVRMRYHAATLLEDGTDVCAVDGATATLLWTRALDLMLDLVCRTRHGCVPRSKELVATVATIDAQLAELAVAFLNATTTTGRRTAIEQIADRTIGTRGFFEWDSGPETVP